MKKIQYLFSLLIVAALVVSCDLDEQADPNNLTPDQADIDALLNGIQTQFSFFYSASQDANSETMRMENLGGASTWEVAYVPSTFNGMWTDAYAEIMIEERVLDEVAKAGGFHHHRAMAKVLTAYTMVTLVDMFGRVPYEEALDATNFVPSPSDGEILYTDALALLDTAIAQFARTDVAGSLNPWDNFYGELGSGTMTNWIKAAKTLKLRIHLQKRLTNESESAAAINALLAENDLILTNAEALNYQYSTSNPAPESRHPDYAGNYPGGANEYMSDSYMSAMYNDKAAPDPRMRYYFYRQDVDPTTDITLRECVGGGLPGWYGATDVFCFETDGYWGRSHLDNAGIPPDNLSRTIYGVYPVGGILDTGQDAPVSDGAGLGGAGIDPILTPATTHFMLAEIALEMPGVTGLNARDEYEAGIRASFDYVGEFSGSPFTDAQVDAYVAGALSQFDAAADPLSEVIQEWYFASWGNGTDMYNAYRRTSYPSNLNQALRLANPGDFPRTYLYPAISVNTNQNMVQKSFTDRVFWDTNPDDLR